MDPEYPSVTGAAEIDRYRIVDQNGMRHIHFAVSKLMIRTRRERQAVFLNGHCYFITDPGSATREERFALFNRTIPTDGFILFGICEKERAGKKKKYRIRCKNRQVFLMEWPNLEEKKKNIQNASLYRFQKGVFHFEFVCSSSKKKLTGLIRNATATTDFCPDRYFVLEEVANKIWNVEFTENFAAAIVRTRDAVEHTTPTMSLFKWGKVNIVGCKSMERIKYWLNWFKQRLAECVHYQMRRPVRDLSIPMQNVVASSLSPYRIDLYAFIRAHPHTCTYEPELFPGLTYRLWVGAPPKKITLLLFASGKYIITGAKCPEHIHEANKAFRVLLPQFYHRKRKAII